MSAEAPKGNQGRLPGFLRRFFEPRPPSELEDFAVQLQAGIDRNSAFRRQRELDERKTEAADRAAQESTQTLLIQKRKTIDATKEAMMTEAMEILDSLHVVEKLQYIQRTVWKERGGIRLIEPELYLFGPASSYDVNQKLPTEALNAEIKRGKRLGGLELFYQYIVPTIDTSVADPSGGFGGPFETQYYASQQAETKIRVVVLRQENQGQNERVLNISSSCEIAESPPKGYRGISYLLDDTFLTELRDSKTLLDRALARETEIRLAGQCLPSQLEERGRKALKDVRGKRP